MSNKTTKSIFCSDAAIPLYCMFADQYRPRPAYIELDLRTGEIDANYSLEDGISIDGWNQCRLFFAVTATLTNESVVQLISDFKRGFDHLYSVSDVDWDGSNWCGGPSSDSGLDREDWNVLIQGLEHELECESNELSISIIAAGDFQEWCYEIPRGDAQELAAEYIEMNGNNDCYFADSINDVDVLASLIRDMWGSNVDKIGAVEAQQLVDDGFIVEYPAMEDDIKDALAR